MSGVGASASSAQGGQQRHSRGTQACREVGRRQDGTAAGRQAGRANRAKMQVWIPVPPFLATARTIFRRLACRGYGPKARPAVSMLVRVLAIRRRKGPSLRCGLPRKESGADRARGADRFQQISAALSCSTHTWRRCSSKCILADQSKQAQCFVLLPSQIFICRHGFGLHVWCTHTSAGRRPADAQGFATQCARAPARDRVCAFQRGTFIGLRETRFRSVERRPPMPCRVD